MAPSRGLSNPTTGTTSLLSKLPPSSQAFIHRRPVLRRYLESKLIFADLEPSNTPSSASSPGQLLILTPLKNSAPYLNPYFSNLAKLSYPKHLITLAFLVSDSTDSTYSKLTSIATSLAHSGVGPNREKYKAIKVFKRDFHFELPEGKRHAYESQPVRRSFLARARNYLLTAALDEEHQWVLWLDSDVVRYDPHAVLDLMSLNKPVVQPNCLWLKDDWEFWGFDRNAWQETESSLSLLSTLSPDHLLVEGYHEFPTHRLHLVDLPTHLGKAHVPLDGVGATFLLVKAEVHREGAIFPTFSFEHGIETEGFAKMCRRMGWEVVGVPGMVVFHSFNG